MLCISNAVFDDSLAKMSEVVFRADTEFNLAQFRNQWYVAANIVWERSGATVLLDSESLSQFHLNKIAAFRTESVRLRAGQAQ